MNKALKRFLSISLVAVGGELIYSLLHKHPRKYSPEWIKRLSENEWRAEREIVRQEMCDPSLEQSVRNTCRSILDLFDKVKSDRDWAGQTPRGPAYHREHGFNLYKDD